MEKYPFYSTILKQLNVNFNNLNVNKNLILIIKDGFGNIKLNFTGYKAFRNNDEIKFSSKEFAIMEYLIRHEGEISHRHDLLNEVWGFEVMPTTRTVDNFILDLRKKLEEDPSNPQHIISIRGAGYRFNS